MSKHNTMNETHEQTGIELVKAGHSLQLAAVCGCKVDDIYSLPAADFTRVCLEVQNFLLNSEK
ncbi:MAG: hypothetical protein E6183_01915 [Veillonella sp.]|nr:hypothetical protein [Veillonella sp.]